MTPRGRPPAPGWLHGHLTVGYHPRDGAPVASWVLSPAADDGHAELDAIAEHLGLRDLRSGVVPTVDVDEAAVAADAERCHLLVGGLPWLAGGGDASWRSALADRGWMVLVLVYSAGWTPASNADLAGWVAAGGRTGAGIIRRA